MVLTMEITIFTIQKTIVGILKFFPVRFADYLVIPRLKRDEIGVCVFPSKHAR